MLDAKPLIEALPFLYSLALLYLTIIHVRRNHAEPVPQACTQCPLNPLCTRLGLNKPLPPAKPSIPRPLKHKVLLTWLLGYLLLSALALEAHVQQTTYLATLYLLTGASLAATLYNLLSPATATKPQPAQHPHSHAKPLGGQSIKPTPPRHPQEQPPRPLR